MRTALPVADEASHASSVFGGWTMAWTETGQPITESQASFGRVFLDARKVAALGVTPNELVRDAPAWDVFIRAAIPEALAYYEDLAYLTGTGAGEPAGMVSCAGSISVAKESGQASATLVYQNVVNMAARLLPTSWPRAIWVAASDAFTEIAAMALAVGTGGSAVFTAENGLTLFGRPVYFADFMPKLGSTGDLVLCDPAYFAIADRAALRVESSPHYRFGEDLTTWRITCRQDARPLLNSAVAPRNGASNSLGAYIQIAAR
jgi:HK97 family phage major capsid protein